MKMKQKKCAVCAAWFVPYQRARNTQLICSRTKCRKSWNRRACYRWRKQNPDYFKGRYDNTKRWLAKRPRYLRRYRAEHPEYVAADNRNRRGRKLRQGRLKADIQQGLLRREIAEIRSLNGTDIQKTLTLRFEGLLDVLAGVPRADIQQGLVRAGPA